MSSASLIQGLRHARVLVLHPQDRDSDELARQLKRIGCHVDLTWPPPASVPDGIDVIYFLLDSDQASRRSWRSGDLRAALIAVIDFENPTILKELLDSNAHGVINKPIRPFGILSSLVLARSMHGYTRRLESKVQKLEETLKARRDVDKAVKILVTLKRVSEAEAYELIRSQATQKRLSMAQVATTIIGAQDVMAGLGLIDER